jgi:hypothetical protein
LVLHGDPADPVVKQAAALLDQSGLSYTTKATVSGERAGSKPNRARSVRISVGADSVYDFSHVELVDFLWAHGAKFEDS